MTQSVLGKSINFHRTDVKTYYVISLNNQMEIARGVKDNLVGKESSDEDY